MTIARISGRGVGNFHGGLSFRLRTVLSMALAVLSLAITSQVRAQTKMCIPQPGWVAGLSGAPRWWDGKDQNGMVIPSYDFTDPQWDPRWIGARADGYGGGTTNDARFRAVFNVENGTTYLYLSWFVNVAPTFSQQNTSLFVGLAPATQGATGTILQATFNSDTGNVSNASSDGAQANPSVLKNSNKWTVTMYQGSGTVNWTSATPAWFTDTSNPTSFQNTATAWANPNGNHQWAVNYRIPLDPTGTNGVNVGNTSGFKIWFYVQPDLEVLGNTIAYIPYTWPRTSADVTTYIVTGDINHPLKFPDPSDLTNPWSSVALESPKAEASCKNGVDLEDDQIGTTNMPTSYINPWGTNTFFAQPSNYGAAVNAQVIKARFRIANWGAQVGDLTSTSWTDIPNLSSVVDTNGIAAGTSSIPTTGNIAGSVDFTSADPAIKAIHCAILGKSGYPSLNPPVPGDVNCSNANPTLEAHQCILVSLTGSNVDFIRDSAFHNMDFTPIDFSQAADISIKGLPPSAAGRDVYIYLEVRNMPSFPTIGSGTPALPEARASITGAGNRHASIFDAAIQAMPTYIVHSYYDTGKTVTTKGVVHPLYQPLTSFGYFIQHKGLYFGWQPSLQGATEVAPHFYKVTIPNDGVVKVNTTINAIDLTTWWIWLIVILIVLIGLLIGWLIGRLIRRQAHA
jgi:hypothetical protein